jgi:hypothetical protein
MCQYVCLFLHIYACKYVIASVIIFSDFSPRFCDIRNIWDICLHSHIYIREWCMCTYKLSGCLLCMIKRDRVAKTFVWNQEIFCCFVLLSWVLLCMDKTEHSLHQKNCLKHGELKPIECIQNIQLFVFKQNACSRTWDTKRGFTVQQHTAYGCSWNMAMKIMHVSAFWLLITHHIYIQCHTYLTQIHKCVHTV